jgi:hypothetical protein
VHLVNHIDEGLYVLKRIGASEFAQRAYAIHPILQGDEDLAAFWNSEQVRKPLLCYLHFLLFLSHAAADVPRSCQVEQMDRRVLLLGMEYRNTANNYLSFKSPDEQIRLSPIVDVNHMLVADKVQNRKDFEIYHKGTFAADLISLRHSKQEREHG